MGHSLRSVRRNTAMTAAVRCAVEALESRQLLSVTLGEDGVLTVMGTEVADTIRVRPAKSPEQFRVVVNGEAAVFARADVSRIEIHALGGDDDVTAFESGGKIDIPMLIFGGEGDDILAGGSASDTIYGGPGNDRIYGLGGDDLLVGGNGDDTLIGGFGNDTLLGGNGNDVLTPGEGENVVKGGAGDDLIDKGAQPRFPIATYTGVPAGYEPRQIRFAYGLGDLNNKDYTNRGQGQAIAIVDAYHTPTARRDLITFSRQFDLPLPTTNALFQQVSGSGRKIRVVDEGWAGEALLDIQWAHAIAPNARIYLVEAASNNFGDLWQAIEKAAQILNRRHRGGVISLSLGVDNEGVFADMFESTFSSPQMRNISVIAAAGDTGQVVSYPATSPYVTAVGGTALYLDEQGNRIGTTVQGGEEPWASGGGGFSTLFDAPQYQLNRGIGPTRGTPDVAWNGDPATGVSVYNTTGDGGLAGWFSVGGTSAGAPQFAGVIALVNQLRRQAKLPYIGSSLNQRLYALGGRGVDAPFNDIDPPGWDTFTGWGSPNARSLIPLLAEQRLTFVNKTIKLSGTRTIYTPSTTGGQALPSWVGFKGSALLQGFTSLNLPAFRFQNTFSPAGSNLAEVDLYGIDADGNSVPPVIDPVTGLITTPGTQIQLFRVGNTITGHAVYQLTDAASGAVLDTGPIKFMGTISAKNKIKGEFFTVDLQGNRIKRIFTNVTQPIINGEFSS